MVRAGRVKVGRKLCLIDAIKIPPLRSDVRTREGLNPKIWEFELNGYRFIVIKNQIFFTIPLPKKLGITELPQI